MNIKINKHQANFNVFTITSKQYLSELQFKNNTLCYLQITLFKLLLLLYNKLKWYV